MNPSGPVRVRIAPSPTGDPHVGTAYMALLNLIFARQRGGQFVLRIEDTDRTRFVATSEQMIFDALRWLGLEWDEGPDKGGPHGPYRQSERTELYRAAVATLLAGGHAYRCFCTPERLEEMRRAQAAAHQPPRYDRACLRLPAEEVARRAAAGEAFTVRLRVPDAQSTTFRDELRGDITFDHQNVDDQVLMKSDGFPTYHLANVVDDHHMAITDVIRAEEWISSTPKHVLLYQAFGWPAPRFWHMPLLRNKDKSKISKRKNPVSLIYYRQAGFLPQALVNFLGLLGGGMPVSEEKEAEKFSLADMFARFQFEQIRLGGPVFDLEKLRWLNGLYLRALAPAEFQAAVRDNLFSDAYLAQIAPLVQERIETLGEFLDLTDFFFLDRVQPAPEVFLPKKRTLPETLVVAGDLLSLLENTAFEHAALEAALRQLATDKGWSAKEVFMLLRALITGKTASPPLLESLLVLGRARGVDRLRRFLDAQKG
ncbi:MAG TPA: glutamate--tRNA ligase [Terriglobales bacterium]|nr:glutamate--tRNA ligase [Terriglobales bacterium]